MNDESHEWDYDEWEAEHDLAWSRMPRFIDPDGNVLIDTSGPPPGPDTEVQELEALYRLEVR